MLVRRLKGRNANGIVEANGEVLFAEGSDLSLWKNRFSNRITAATIAAAPTNKRPRWAHYGKPLKATITSSTMTRLTKGGGRFYIGVGSKAPYALYVDQGTGIHNPEGGAPYEASVLPPYQWGSASLYERTWRPLGPQGRRVAPVMIKGQKGQGFFAQGLKDSFRSMRMRSFQVPGEGTSAMRSAMNTIPSGLLLGPGNTPADSGFQASLDMWRSWRKEAWEAGEGLGRGGGIGSRRHTEYRNQQLAEADRQKAQNIRNYKASVKAAKKRKQDLLRNLKKEEERKSLGAAKEKARKEKEARREREFEEKLKQRQGFNRAMLDARARVAKMKGQYPDASVEFSGLTSVRVRYTKRDGSVEFIYFRLNGKNL